MQSGCLKDLTCKNIEINGKMVGGKRNIINITAQTAETNLSVKDSGALIMLSGTPSQIQVINLPTIKPEDVGTTYEFYVAVIGNGSAPGSYTINTGGHATDSDSRTAGYDDFIGLLRVIDATEYTATDTTNAVPGSGDGTLVLANDTTNGEVKVGSCFTCTAVAASDIGTASSDVWLVQGVMIGDAAGWVTTALFTPP